MACQKYDAVVEKVKAAAAASSPDPFAGMAGGQAVSARSARSAGRGRSIMMDDDDDDE